MPNRHCRRFGSIAVFAAAPRGICAIFAIARAVAARIFSFFPRKICAIFITGGLCAHHKATQHEEIEP